MGNDFKYEGYSDELMLNYTKQMFNIQDSTSLSLFVITDNDCHSCDEYLLNFITTNIGVINATKTCLLLTGTNIKYFNRLRDEYNLEKVNNLAIDTTDIYNDLHHFSDYNPRLLLVRENKVVSDTIYMPEDLEQMMIDYINFYSFETE